MFAATIAMERMWCCLSIALLYGRGKTYVEERDQYCIVHIAKEYYVSVGI